MRLFLTIIIFAALVGAGPTAPARPSMLDDKPIQGTWRFQSDDDHGHAFYLEWTFDKGKFKLEGYPPLLQEGSYRIVKTAGQKMTLELYDQKGNFGTENSQIEIVVNKRRGALMIKGQGPFTRVKVQA